MRDQERRDSRGEGSRKEEIQDVSAAKFGSEIVQKWFFVSSLFSITVINGNPIFYYLDD